MRVFFLRRTVAVIGADGILYRSRTVINGMD